MALSLENTIAVARQQSSAVITASMYTIHFVKLIALFVTFVHSKPSVHGAL